MSVCDRMRLCVYVCVGMYECRDVCREFVGRIRMTMLCVVRKHLITSGILCVWREDRCKMFADVEAASM